MNNKIKLTLAISISVALTSTNLLASSDEREAEIERLKGEYNNTKIVLSVFKDTDSMIDDFKSSSSEDSVSSANARISGEIINIGSSSINKNFVLSNESASSGACLAGINDGATRDNNGDLESCQNGVWTKMDVGGGAGPGMCQYEFIPNGNYVDIYGNSETQKHQKIGTLQGFKYSSSKKYMYSTITKYATDSVSTSVPGAKINGLNISGVFNRKISIPISATKNTWRNPPSNYTTAKTVSIYPTLCGDGVQGVCGSTSKGEKENNYIYCTMDGDSGKSFIQYSGNRIL